SLAAVGTGAGGVAAFGGSTSSGTSLRNSPSSVNKRRSVTVKPDSCLFSAIRTCPRIEQPRSRRTTYKRRCFGGFQELLFSLIECCGSSSFQNHIFVLLRQIREDSPLNVLAEIIAYSVHKGVATFVTVGDTFNCRPSKNLRARAVEARREIGIHQTIIQIVVDVLDVFAGIASPLSFGQAPFDFLQI